MDFAIRQKGKPMDDLISRQAAIDSLCRGPGCGNICSRAIEQLPGIDEHAVVTEYCKRRNLVVITADSYRMFTLGNYCMREEKGDT